MLRYTRAVTTPAGHSSKRPGLLSAKDADSSLVRFANRVVKEKQTASRSARQMPRNEAESLNAHFFLGKRHQMKV